MTLLWMKLGPINISTLHHGGKLGAVARRRQNVGWIGAHEVIRMDKVETDSLTDVVPQGALLLWCNRIPSHMRYFQCGNPVGAKPHALTLNQTQPIKNTFLARPAQE